MDWFIVKSDLKRNKVISLTLLMFIMFSSCMAALSAIITVQTITSISEFYDKAQPPHFLQMHKGELDQKAIDDFSSQYPGVDYWQTEVMLDVYGENITVVNQNGDFDLSDCMLDIGLVFQNEERDLLLDANHKKVEIKEGYIGIPVLLKEMFQISIGDKIIIENNDITLELLVSDIVLDSQMNSPLVSSTRILLNDKDFDYLDGKIGEKEYIIEAYFTDINVANTFKSDYETAGLPQNGQAVTYPIIFLLSAFTDMVTVFVLIVVSFLLIIMSFICIRYTIMATLEDEISEIGTMKAIGINNADIRKIYMGKYMILSAVGGALGYVLAIAINSLFTSHISITFGNTGIYPTSILYSFISTTFVFLIISIYCRTILRKIKKLTVVEAMVGGNGFNIKKKKARGGLHKIKGQDVNWTLSYREVLYSFRDWKIVFIIIMLVSFMVILPLKLVGTFESKDFIRYMGTSVEDIMIEIENGDDIKSSHLKVLNMLKDDSSVYTFYEYKSIRVKTTNADGDKVNMDIDCGSNAGNNLIYLYGEKPADETQIALSYLNSVELGKNIGDEISIEHSNGVDKFYISGIYQDVTSGGYTAKTTNGFIDEISKKYSFTIDLIDGVDIESKSDEWSKYLGAGINVDPMTDFIDQTLGGVIKQLKGVVLYIAILGVILVSLIMLLFIRLRLIKDFAENAILKAIGFSFRDIRKQYIFKVSLVTVLGLLIGQVLIILFGDAVINFGLGLVGIGIKSVVLVDIPLVEYIVFPIAILGVVTVVTIISVVRVKAYNIISLINE